jgi:protein-export membrane protein SecD
MLQFARWKVITILSTVFFGVLFAAPNLMPQNVRDNLPGFMPTKTVNLGLDLQGGAHLLLEVKMEVVFAERLENVKIEARQTLNNRDENVRILHTARVKGDELVILISKPEEVDQAYSLIRGMSGTVGVGAQGLGALNQELEITKRGTKEIVVQLTEAAQKDIESKSVQQVIEVIGRRIDELGTREPTVQRQGSRRVIVQVPGASDPQAIIRIIEQTAKLTLQAVYSDDPSTIQEAMEGRTYRDAVLMPNEDPQEPFILIESKVTISGDMLVDAQPAFDQQYNRPIVTFRLNSAGAKKFGRYSTENVGKRFAIILDGRVISAPRIQTAITGGNAQISGNFTTESANQLAILLRAGALPAPVTIEEQRSVGPEMGADSIAAGKTAAMIGLAAVIIFIILAYGRFGVYANIALFANLTLIFGVLSMLQATLTLPGIAGIVLTIGMAVDANVLIFERMREEIRAGKTPINAVEAGYQKAWSSIRDANVTTLFAAIILFFVGTGPVKGFSVTLAIGIFTSVFTAFVLTRFIIATWLRRTRPSQLPI